jgi:hypothetical protein
MSKLILQHNFTSIAKYCYEVREKDLNYTDFNTLLALPSKLN